MFVWIFRIFVILNGWQGNSGAFEELTTLQKEMNNEYC